MRPTTGRHLAVLAAVALLVAAASGAGAVAASEASEARAVDGGAADAVVAGQTDCSFPVTRTDATGTEVTVEADPDRVVVLQASAAQTMWELDARNEVVGMPVAYYTTYLPGAENRTNVVNRDGTVDAEQVVALEPDVVLAPNIVPNATVAKLRSAGLTVYKFSFGNSIPEIYDKTALIGRLTGNCAAADRVVSEMRSRVEAIRAASDEFENPRVLYLIGNFTAGNRTFIGNAIELAGGENVAAEAGIRRYRALDEEQVLALNPDVIVEPSGPPDVPKKPGYNETYAVRNGQVLTVDANLISQPAPRVVEPMERMQAYFRNASRAGAETPTRTTVGATVTDTPTPTATPTAADGGDGESGDGGDGGDGEDQRSPTPGGDVGGPGFGVLAALVALVGGALLVGRRTR